MSPIQEIKNNPIITILLAVMVCLMTLGGTHLISSINANTVSLNNEFNRLWNKLDRVTSLMMEEKKEVMLRIRDVEKMTICNNGDIQQIKERMTIRIQQEKK